MRQPSAGPGEGQPGEAGSVSTSRTPALCRGKLSRSRRRNSKTRLWAGCERGVREGVDRDDFRAGGVRGGPGGMSASGVPPRPALFMIFMLPGRPFDFAARGDAQTDSPAPDPPHAKGGRASFSEVEPRANIEGGGGTSGQPGRDDGAIRGCDDTNLAHCAFNPAPRGNSPLGLTTPPTTPQKRWGKGQQSPA